MTPFAALALAGALIGFAAPVASAAASEYRCERADDAIRRVEIVSEDPSSGVPCEVVYWKDTEEPGVRTVLWNAQTDAGFCQRKADELVGTLEGGGWACRQNDRATEEAAAEPSPASRQDRNATQPPAQSEPPQARSEPPQTESEPPATAASERQAEPEAAPATRSASEEQSEEPEEEKEQDMRAALAPQPGPSAPGPSSDEPAEDGPRSAMLDSIIEQNLVRLNDGVEGRFAAEIGGYGDLDDDGLEDGLVFFTYESTRLGEARFVAAYLFDGESYALAATKPVAGSDDNIHSAEVEAITGGVISLRLNVLEPGDAECCPSGIRDQNLVLRGGQLVEVRNSASPRSEEPS